MKYKGGKAGWVEYIESGSERNVQIISLFSWPSWFAYSESPPIYLGRSVDLFWAVWGLLRLGSCLGPVCTCSQSLQLPLKDRLRLNAGIQIAAAVNSGVVSLPFLCSRSPWCPAWFWALLCFQASIPRLFTAQTRTDESSCSFGLSGPAVPGRGVCWQCSLRWGCAGCLPVWEGHTLPQGSWSWVVGPLAEPSHSGSQQDIGDNSQLLTAWWSLRSLGLRPQTALAFSLWRCACLFASGTTDHSRLAVLWHLPGQGPSFCDGAESKGSTGAFPWERSFVSVVDAELPGLPLLCCASPQSTSRAVGPGSLPEARPPKPGPPHLAPSHCGQKWALEPVPRWQVPFGATPVVNFLCFAFGAAVLLYCPPITGSKAPPRPCLWGGFPSMWKSPHLQDFLPLGHRTPSPNPLSPF